MTMTEPIHDTRFASGAVRSGDANHLDFMSISPIAMIALARTCQEGGSKYGYHNWEQGMDTIDLLNHAQRHLWMWQSGDRSEPHLPHAFWGLMAAIHMDVLHPELSAARRRGPGCSLTPEMKAHLAEMAADLAEKRKAGFFASAGRWVLDQVAEVRAILAGRPREIHVSATTSLDLGSAADSDSEADQFEYAVDAVRGRPVADEDDADFASKWDPPAPGRPERFAPQFEKLPH